MTSEPTTKQVPHWRAVESDDGPALQRLYERDPAFFEDSFGHPPGVEAVSAFNSVPEGMAPDDKLMLGGFDDDGEMRAFADVWPQWPEPGTWTVASLFVDPRDRGTGLADDLWAQVEQAIRSGAGTRVRTSPASDQTRALAYFRRCGLAGDERVTRRLGLRNLELVILTKDLS
jgi:ribosomal protein S18 acetylase RimI-like enzyme